MLTSFNPFMSFIFIEQKIIPVDFPPSKSRSNSQLQTSTLLE
jgi:hypothetical protein